MPKGIRFSLFLYRPSASRCLEEEDEEVDRVGEKESVVEREYLEFGDL